MGATFEEALQELAGSVSSVVESALSSAISAADIACTFWAGPWSGWSGTSERVAHVTERFISEIRPRYDDGYQAGIAVAETISWSQLSELVKSPWRIPCARFSEDSERVLEARWGKEWRTQLTDTITVRGMHEALSEVWAAVTKSEFSGSDGGSAEGEDDAARANISEPSDDRHPDPEQ